MQIMQESPLDYPLLARGKGHDLYDPRVMLSTNSTDRFSFDGVLDEPIFHKGETQSIISAFPFELPVPTASCHTNLLQPVHALLPTESIDQAFDNGS